MSARAARDAIQPIRVLIAEDETLLSNALMQLLPQVRGAAIAVVATCATRSQTMRQTRTLAPDVILLDLRMPDRVGAPCTLRGGKTVATLLRQCIGARIICLTAHTEANLVRECLDAGAKGFLGKGSLPELIGQAIRTVMAGGCAIDPSVQAQLDLLAAGPAPTVRSQLLDGRRGEVLRLLLDGYSPTEIAVVLPIGKKHVDKQIAAIKTILGVSTSIRIYRMCRHLGIVDE